jgi:hypothetical protein
MWVNPWGDIPFLLHQPKNPKIDPKIGLSSLFCASCCAPSLASCRSPKSGQVWSSTLQNLGKGQQPPFIFLYSLWTQSLSRVHFLSWIGDGLQLAPSPYIFITLNYGRKIAICIKIDVPVIKTRCQIIIFGQNFIQYHDCVIFSNLLLKCLIYL